MQIYKFGRELEQVTEQEYLEALQARKNYANPDEDELPEGETSPKTKAKRPGKVTAIFVADSSETEHVLKVAGISYEGETDLDSIGFCKVEAQQSCLAGTLRIPKLSDVDGDKIKIRYFINRKNIVIIDDSKLTKKAIRKVRQLRTKAATSRERFLYNYMSQFLSKDLEYLGKYERMIADLEDQVQSGEIDEFHDRMIPIRRDLLILRSYYMELMDMMKDLEENDNGFFAKRNLSYFGTLEDRAERLRGRSVYLIDYMSQVRDAYQTQVAKEQNRNMQFLTMVTTIFYPLTLITGWYGMNFENMPELTHGYPFVIGLSIVTLGIIIIIFKKRKIL